MQPGISPVSFYTLDIFTEKLKLPVPKEILSPLVGVTEVVGSCISVSLIDRIGRRILLITSGLGMFASHFLTSASFYVIGDAHAAQVKTLTFPHLNKVGFEHLSNSVRYFGLKEAKFEAQNQ